MRICLVAEGCYPYVTGGVSSWIQMLTESLPQHEFIVVAISAKKSDESYKYQLPKNVSKVIDVYLELDEKQKVPSRRKRKVKFTYKEQQELYKFISGQTVDWTIFLATLSRYRKVKTVDFLMSQAFLDVVMKVSQDIYPHIVFNHFFWTIRSMMIPFLEVVKQELPKADIYHSVSTGYAGLLATIGKLTHNGKLLLTEHGIYTREREEEIIKADWVKGYFKDNWIKYFYQLSTCTYLYADQVISLFENSRHLQIELGCAVEKTLVIPNGVDIEKFNTPQNVTIHKKENKVIVGAIVRVVPIKDIKTLIQSFALVKNHHLDFEIELHIIGPTDEDPAYMRECEVLIESLQVKDIIFTGRVNTQKYIHNLDLVILSSISEGQPLSTLEAMAAKKACICTDVGACYELLNGIKDSYGPCGIIVPIMGYEEMANAIIELASDHVKRQLFGENGYQRVINYYRQDQFINRYQILYEELVG